MLVGVFALTWGIGRTGRARGYDARARLPRAVRGLPDHLPVRTLDGGPHPVGASRARARGGGRPGRRGRRLRRQRARASPSGLQPHGGGPARAGADPPGVRDVCRPPRRRAHPRGGDLARGRGGRRDPDVPRHTRLHAYAARSDAQDVVATLNRLFERAVSIVHEHGGHVDKFIGDGLLAVFGAPRRERRHADRALDAALALSDAAKEEFGGEIEVGMGLSSGPVVAGNVGGAGRLDFSVIGDAVNVAARAEAATRYTGDRVLLTDETARRLEECDAELEERSGDRAQGKGRAGETLVTGRARLSPGRGRAAQGRPICYTAA